MHRPWSASSSCARYSAGWVTVNPYSRTTKTVDRYEKTNEHQQHFITSFKTCANLAGLAIFCCLRVGIGRSQFGQVYSGPGYGTGSSIAPSARRSSPAERVRPLVISVIRLYGPHETDAIPSSESLDLFRTVLVKLVHVNAISSSILPGHSAELLTPWAARSQTVGAPHRGTPGRQAYRASGRAQPLRRACRTPGG